MFWVLKMKNWCPDIMKRGFDLLMAILIVFMIFLPLLIIYLSVKTTSVGPAIYWSERVGRKNKIFKMPKFRTMRVGTPAVATHLLVAPKLHLTSIGGFLRRTSLDELPQLYSIIKGDMSFVGPRPALFNQSDLIALRTEHGVHKLIPGLTGWAQINGRDEVDIQQKVSLDCEYLAKRSLFFDVKILILTVTKVLKFENITH